MRASEFTSEIDRIYIMGEVLHRSPIWSFAAVLFSLDYAASKTSRSANLTDFALATLFPSFASHSAVAAARVLQTAATV
jgi:hypothetical protein